MSRTKDSIIDEMVEEMPFRLDENIRPYIKEAMRIYADQEAKAYANWLFNQSIQGRTSTSLWNDYQFEINS